MERPQIVYMPPAILAPKFVPSNWRGNNSGWEIAATQSTNHESLEKRPSLVGLPKMAVLAWGPTADLWGTLRFCAVGLWNPPFVRRCKRLWDVTRFNGNIPGRTVGYEHARHIMWFAGLVLQPRLPWQHLQDHTSTYQAVGMASPPCAVEPFTQPNLLPHFGAMGSSI